MLIHVWMKTGGRNSLRNSFLNKILNGKIFTKVYRITNQGNLDTKAQSFLGGRPPPFKVTNIQYEPSRIQVIILMHSCTLQQTLSTPLLTIADVIVALRSSVSVTRVVYTWSSMSPQRKKLQGVILGDLDQNSSANLWECQLK